MRENYENTAILHIVVREDYSAIGIHANQMLVMHLIDRVRQIAAIKGVNTITIAYKAEKNYQNTGQTQNGYGGKY